MRGLPCWGHLFCSRKSFTFSGPCFGCKVSESTQIRPPPKFVFGDFGTMPNFGFLEIWIFGTFDFWICGIYTIKVKANRPHNTIHKSPKPQNPQNKQPTKQKYKVWDLECPLLPSDSGLNSKVLILGIFGQVQSLFWGILGAARTLDFLFLEIRLHAAFPTCCFGGFMVQGLGFRV